MWYKDMPQYEQNSSVVLSIIQSEGFRDAVRSV